MPIEVVQGEGLPQGSLPFSPGIKAGGFVFVSGQASVDDDGKIVSDTFEGETRRSFDNVGKILAAEGLDFSRVVRMCAYLHSPDDFPQYNEIYREYLREPFPARTTIVNCLPDAIKFEVDVIAYAGD